MKTLAVALVLSLTALSAWAQDSALQLAPSPSVECLTPAADVRGRPEYPEVAYRLKEGGTVQVELTFTAADSPPDVKFLSDSGPYAFQVAVRLHVDRFRMPCLSVGQEPVRLRQDYVFIPNDGRKVTWSSPKVLNDHVRDAALRCMKHVHGYRTPTYPYRSAMAESEGTVFVRMRFSGPDEPPVLTVLDPGSEKSLVGAVEAFVDGYRMPCLTGGAVTVDRLFSFRMADGVVTLLRDASLVAFLRGVRDPGRESVYFDFSTMGCPFDVRMLYQRPSVANIVGEVETQHLARRPFLDWLSGLALNLNARDNNAILGRSMTIHVPCGTLDL